MDCLHRSWDAGKTCCGPKTFYTVVAVAVGALLLAACLAIAIPIHLRDGQELQAVIRALPALPAATVQVQGPSHSLVHFQEGIDVGGKDGSPRIGGPIRHWGLVVAVGICSLLCVVVLARQVWRFVTFRPRTAELPLTDPMEEVRQLLLVEAQGRERRDRQLAQIRARDSALLQGAVAMDGPSSAPSLKVEGSALGVVGGPVAALRASAPSPAVLTGMVSGMVGGPVAAPRGLVPSAGVGVRPGLLPSVKAGVSVSPPQVLGAGLGALVPAVGAVPLSRCELQRLQLLRDEARWAAEERARLSVRAPVFVPAAVRPVVPD